MYNMLYAFAEQGEIGDGVVRNLLRGPADMTMKSTESLVMLSVQSPEVHTAHAATNTMMKRETEKRIIDMIETNTTNVPKGADEPETPEHQRRSPSPSTNSTVSSSSGELESHAGSSHRMLRGKSPIRRSRSPSRSRNTRKPETKHRDKDREKKHKKRKDRDSAKDKERRSVLTGKKIKLKVHKDARDLEMDANRQNLLQFLNSTYEYAENIMPLLDPLNAVRNALTDAGVIPDVIPADPPFIPKALLVVTFPTCQEALLGNTLTKSDTADEPTVAFTPMQVPDVTEEPTYTLVMTDPDAPSRKDPKFGQWRHWVTTGVKAPPLSTFETGNLAAQLTKSAVTPYQPPAPPRGTGPHRYVLLLYQEPSSDFSIPAAAPERKNGPADRKNWNAAKFADKYELKPYLTVMLLDSVVLIQAGIIPDVIPANPHFDPQALLFVTLPVGPVLLGNTLNSTTSLTPPNISFTPMHAPADQLYTIAMVDPDAPTRENQTYGGYRHWLATGIKPPQRINDLAVFTQADTTPYLSPNPPAGSGSHRYSKSAIISFLQTLMRPPEALLLYREPSNNFAIPEGAIEYGGDFNSRKNWNATVFAEKYGLELVAANFFHVSGP
ncbi:hypothetical protein AZE42_04330 [Rhizopogon vesiculosus]|uniref:PEBP-like protein n=1 Tax=Rhizopogon vesiculosus TaxID=180088 RepID=A0A1J8PT18_9AGAM|nr:hypothetical protein AZE42_04330 [Rhizopogon vesiculosus]